MSLLTMAFGLAFLFWILTTLFLAGFHAFSTDLFTQLGCDPASHKVVVVKSSQHFYESFAKIAEQVIYVRAPGVVAKDFTTLNFRKVSRPRWPFDELTPSPNGGGR